MAQSPPGPVLRAIGDPGFCGSRRRSGIVCSGTWQWHFVQNRFSSAQAHSIAFAQFLGVEKVGFFRGSDNATTDCLTRVKPWLARLRAYAAWDGRPSDGGFDGVARACARGSSDRSCAAAWRRRAEHGAAALGRKHPTVVPRLLATCA